VAAASLTWAVRDQAVLFGAVASDSSVRPSPPLAYCDETGGRALAAMFRSADAG
jgi:hypothetical protein